MPGRKAVFLFPLENYSPRALQIVAQSVFFARIYYAYINIYANIDFLCKLAHLTCISLKNSSLKFSSVLWVSFCIWARRP